MRERIRKPLVAEINVVPYIDVMLVLLIIFMITAPLLTQGVNVDLPKANAKVINSERVEPIIVSVDKKGNYFLNITENPNTSMNEKKLVTRIAAELRLAEKNKPMVLVKGDKNVDYGRVVNVMVLLQRAGVEHVGLLTEDPVKL